MNIWRASFDVSDPASERIERVTVGEGNDVYLSGPDAAGRIAFATIKNRSDIYEFTLESGALRQVTTETVAEDYADLSSDGKTLLLVSVRDGSPAIWTADLQGKLLSRIAPGTYARWAPDGQRLAYITGTPPGIVLRRLGDLSSETVAANTNFVEWTADGKHLLFDRPLVNNKRAVFMKDLANGSERQITPALDTRSSSPGISSDGKWITYQADEAGVRQIWAMPVAGGPQKRITSGENESSHPRFRPNAPDWIVYLENHKNVILRSLTTGETKRLTNFNDANLIVDFPAWSPDGTKIYFTIARSVGDVFLLENY